VSADDYVNCWFIGGPWNNQLMKVHRNYVTKHRTLIVPIIPKMIPSEIKEGPIRHDDVMIKNVIYHLSFPLKTGVPVYSSLNIY
jgi:hypothetical protein